MSRLQRTQRSVALKKPVKQQIGSRAARSPRTKLSSFVTTRMRTQLATSWPLCLETKGLAKAMKTLAKVEVAPDEILYIVDSGSLVHASDADVELPDHSIRENDPKERPMVCEKAYGGILKKLGTVRVNSEVVNDKVAIEFDHMRVSV